ncbi:helix-turn-helix domain-containing protein [Rubritalea tangerina]|uniref:Helix-turn-helix domain-containing protein n=1 Tax=Rubritalea tangerina TaxID=430798 RepID=A0ABW4Z9W4_9BACT
MVNDVSEFDRDAWLARIDVTQGFTPLLEHLPGVSFFAKNLDGALMKANQNFLVRFGFRDESELIGKTDYDLFPPSLVENFRKDDLEVIGTSTPKLNIIELFFNRQGLPDWYFTNKLPILDKDGEAIGVMGVTWSHGGSQERMQPFSRVAPAIEFIRENFRSKVTIQELAEMSGFSTRQFGRHFQDAFGTTPQQFIMKTRIQAACEELRKSDMDLATLAMNLGFYDQSSFTMHFRKHIGVTPLQFRKQNRESSQ